MIKDGQIGYNFISSKPAWQLECLFAVAGLLPKDIKIHNLNFLLSMFQVE